MTKKLNITESDTDTDQNRTTKISNPIKITSVSKAIKDEQPEIGHSSSDNSRERKKKEYFNRAKNKVFCKQCQILCSNPPLPPPH